MSPTSRSIDSMVTTRLTNSFLPRPKFAYELFTRLYSTPPKIDVKSYYSIPYRIISQRISFKLNNRNRRHRHRLKYQPNFNLNKFRFLIKSFEY